MLKRVVDFRVGSQRATARILISSLLVIVAAVSATNMSELFDVSEKSDASIDSMNFDTPLLPGGQTLYRGAALYEATETRYNVQLLINANGVVPNSQYGQPYLYQAARQIRLGARFTF